MVLGLIRNLVPRIRDYSYFATEVAAGGRPGLLNPRGEDELAELGRALNDMVERNRLRTEREDLQTEFVDTLQVTATEDEAHDLTKRHIERSVPGTPPPFSPAITARTGSGRRPPWLRATCCLNDWSAPNRVPVFPYGSPAPTPRAPGGHHC